MTVTLYGPMEGKAKFTGLPGGTVEGGGEGIGVYFSIPYSIHIG